MQRSAGNAAVGRLLRRDPQALRRLQRTPTFRPNPPWSVKGDTQGGGACTPLGQVEASLVWEALSATVPAAARKVTGCPDVRDVWDAYFAATGARRFVWRESDTPDNCAILQLKRDRANLRAEDPIVEAVRTALPTLIGRLEGTSSVTLPLEQAGVPAALLQPELRFTNPLQVGGMLFGGISKPDRATGVRPPDSEFGPDTRRIDGTVTLTRVIPDPFTSFGEFQVQARFDLGFHLTDALDFCPGNTELNVPGIKQALILLSRLEASGMTRDVFLEAHYTRTRDAGPFGPFQDPRRFTVPGKALFEFGSPDLSPGAERILLETLGDRPARADPARPVKVRGHTDSIGAPERNQALSEQRADAVKRVLEERFSNLRGHVEAEGAGDREPVAPNTTPDGQDDPAARALNRRVEIELTELAP